jgi:hypothetical protein
MGAILNVIAAGGGFTPVTNTFDSGAGTITAPSGATSVLIKAWGGGGGGSRDNTNGVGTGGGSGSYITQTLVVVGGSTVFTYNVQSGGYGRITADGNGFAANTPVTVTFAASSTTVSSASPQLPTLTNTAVQLSTSGTLPSPFATGTTYYVVAGTTTAISLSATPGGAAITSTGTGTGAHTLTANATAVTGTVGTGSVNLTANGGNGGIRVGTSPTAATASSSGTATPAATATSGNVPGANVQDGSGSPNGGGDQATTGGTGTTPGGGGAGNQVTGNGGPGAPGRVQFNWT